MYKTTKLKVTDANILFFLVIMLMLFGGYLVTIVLSAMNFGVADNFRRFSLMILINQIGFILFPTLVFAFSREIDFRKCFRLNPIRFFPTVVVILCMGAGWIVATFLNELVLFLLSLIGRVPVYGIPAARSPVELTVYIFLICILPAVCEEMLHRGILLGAYENRGTRAAIVISSVMFGIFHFDIQNLLGPILLGAIIGYAVVRTDSIFTGMIAHFANNLISIVLSYFLGDSSTGSVMYTQVYFDEILALFFYAVVAGIVLIMLLKLLGKITEYTEKPPVSSARGHVVSVITHWPVIAVLVLYFMEVLGFVLTIVFD